MSEQNASTSTPSAPAPTQPVTQAAPTPAPQESNAASSAEILKQAQILAERVKQQEALLARYAQKDAKERDNRAKEWLPRAEQYIKQLEEDQGRPLSNEQKEQIKETFTAVDEDLQENANALWQQHSKRVELTASRIAAEERAKAMEEENRKLKETLSLASQTVQNGMRAGYANTMMATIDASKSAPAPVTQQHRVSVNEIFVSQTPGTPQEEKALKKRGFLAPHRISVNASAADESFGYKPYAQSLPKPPEHNNLYNEDGSPKNPNAWRYTNPAFAAAMHDPKTLNMSAIQDFSSVGDVRIISDARYTFLERTEGTDANIGSLL